MNLTLTVVYNSFTEIESQKYKELFFHKRKASNFAFNLLTFDDSQELSYKHFKSLMLEFQPLKSNIDVLLMFKMLDKSGSGSLSRDEFARIYEDTDYKWVVKNPLNESWYTGSEELVIKAIDLCNIIASSPVFEYLGRFNCGFFIYYFKRLLKK